VVDAIERALGGEAKSVSLPMRVLPCSSGATTQGRRRSYLKGTLRSSRIAASLAEIPQADHDAAFRSRTTLMAALELIKP
jgi:hypothetical protein